MRTFLSRFIKLMLILLVISGLCFALLPTLASSTWGRKQIVSWINRSIPGNVEIRNFDLHWGKGQVLEGILLKDPEGQSVVGIEKFSTEATLWQILRKSTHLGLTQVQDLNAAIVTDEKGRTNLQRALGIPLSNDTPPLLPSTIILSDVNANLNLFSHQRPLSAWIKGLTRQENLNGSFEVNLSLDGLQASDWEELKHDAQNYLSIEGSKEAKIQAHVVNFPVDLIDRLVALDAPQLNGLFHSILGDRLNLTIDKESSPDGLAFRLTALAPLMQGDVKGQVVNNILTLKDAAVFQFNLAPDFVNPFTHYQFELLNPSKLKVIFSMLSFPLNFLDSEATIDPCHLGCKADLILTETALDIASLGKLNIHNLQAYLDSPLCDKGIQVNVTGQAQQGKEPFDIHFDSTLDKPTNLSSFLKQLAQNFQGSLKISHLPLQLIPFLQQHPEWIENIGSHADIQVKLIPYKKEEWEATLSAQTSRLALKEAHFRVGKDVVLSSPTQLNWTISPDCLQTLFKTDSLTLNQPCPLQLTVQQFQIPLDNPMLAKFHLELAAPSIQFSHLLSWGAVHVQDLVFKADRQNLTQFTSQLKGQLALLTPEGSNSPLLKQPLQFNQTSNWKLGSDGILEMPSGQLQVNNSISHLQIEGRLTANRDLEITQPAQIQYTLTPLALQTLSHLLSKDWPTLLDETPIRLTIDPASFNLNTLTLSSAPLKGQLTIDQLALQDATGTLPRLEKIALPWVIDTSTNYFSAHLKGFAHAQRNVKPSPVSADVQVWFNPEHLDIAHTKAEIQMNSIGVPTSLLNMLMTTHDLSPVLGPMMDVNIKTFFDPDQEKPGYCDLALDSAQFHLNGRFKLGDTATVFDPNKPPEIQWTVTPESYAYLKKIFNLQDVRQLSAPFVISGSLSQFLLPLKNASLDQSQLVFKLSTTDIQWQEAGTAPIKLEAEFNSQNLNKQFDFSAKVLSTSPLLTLKGTVSNIFDQQGKMRAWQDMGLTAKIQGQQLTPMIIQSLFLLDNDQTQKLKALFGDTLDLQANCQLQHLNGPLQASATGPQGQIHLDGQMKQGILTLNQPLKGSVNMTPLLSQTFLAKNIPILSTAIGAESPIRFSIDSSQFSCPLVPFNLEQVKIGKGTLELGKIRFRNEGALNSILSLIRSMSDPYLTIWFTPLYFQLDQGILALRRLDMLVANTYTLASWGNVNLITHQADLVLGLSAQTLQYAFGIQNLDESYLLQVPLRSANGKVEIDKKKATARISALLAQTQVGSTGKLLGNLIDLALSNKGEVVPAPTTQPFPWQGEINTTPSAAPSTTQNPQASPPAPASDPSTSNSDDPDVKKKKKRKHHKEAESSNSLKGLQEGAGQIFDQLFR